MTTTPGPWHVQKFNDIKSYWVDGNGKSIARKIELEDDARLIAASPDLLDACETLLEAIDRHYPNDWQGIKSKAISAIAKANKKAVAVCALILALAPLSANADFDPSISYFSAHLTHDDREARLPVNGWVLLYSPEATYMSVKPMKVETFTRSRVLWEYPGEWVTWTGYPDSVTTDLFEIVFRRTGLEITGLDFHFLDPPLIDEPLIHLEPDVRPWRLESLISGTPEPQAWVMAAMGLLAIWRRR